MFARPLVIATSLLLLLRISSAAAGSYAQVGTKLIAADPTGAPSQGNSVALSSDGSTAVVGGPSDNASIGAMWAYTRSGSVWSQQGPKLVGTGGGTANQGISIAVSADGNTAIEGGYLGAGAAWVFTRSSGAWSQQGAKLVGTGAIGSANQGNSVAMSADGNTAIVGGSVDNSNAGAFWVFTRTGGVWTQQGIKLVGTGAIGPARQGWSVSLSADGNTAVVGGKEDNGTVGAAWVFTRSGGVWSQQGAKLVGTGSVGTAFEGYSVAVSADGNTAVVGGNSDNGGVGAAWVFTRSGGVWSQQGAKLVGTGAAGLAFQGSSVAVSADGNTAAVGGAFDNSSVGAEWVFTRSGGVWSQRGAKFVGTGAVGICRQGFSTAMTGDGKLVLVGGNLDNTNVGAVWTFVDASPTIVTIHDVPNDQGGKVSLRWTASLLDNTPGNPIEAYWIWRQVPIHMAIEALAHDASHVREGAAEGTLFGPAFRSTIESAQVYYWEFVGSQVAHGFPAYSYTTSTFSDSVPGSNPYTLFMVETERLSTGEYWSSDPDSGYSVDNLPPGPPAPVAAVYLVGATHLHWGVSVESDFAMYRLYRGGSAGFVPGPGNLVTTQPDTGYADVGAAGSYYKLSAVDAHGNESVFALVTPGMTTGVNDAGSLGFALEGVRPNPTNASGLNVAFALPTGATALLELLDLSGRRVLSREVGSLGAGRHTVNLAEGRRVAPGIYWVRLAQGANRSGTRVAVIE